LNTAIEDLHKSDPHKFESCKIRTR